MIGIGGSATNDGGIGAAQALGLNFWMKTTVGLALEARNWAELRELSLDNVDPRIKESTITVICDVTNPSSLGPMALPLCIAAKGR